MKHETRTNNKNKKTQANNKTTNQQHIKTINNKNTKTQQMKKRTAKQKNAKQIIITRTHQPKSNNNT